MKKKLFITTVFLFFTQVIISSPEIKKMVICVPVADLRSGPAPTPPGLTPPVLWGDLKVRIDEHTVSGQETQLLLNEHVLAEKVPDHPDWLKIEIIEQERCRNNEGSNERGYIKKAFAKTMDDCPNYNIVVAKPLAQVYLHDGMTMTVSMGTKFCGKQEASGMWRVTTPNQGIGYLRNEDCHQLKIVRERNQQELRHSIVALVQTFVGKPYVWGGCSMHNTNDPTQITGFDCSGFFYLIFRAYGIDIPRDSCSQQIRAKKLKSGAELQPGDLIFTGSTKDPFHINHVLMYLGTTDLHGNYHPEGWIIESYGAHYFSKHDAPTPAMLGVRVRSICERFCLSRNELISGTELPTRNGKHIWLGSPFVDKK